MNYWTLSLLVAFSISFSGCGSVPTHYENSQRTYKELESVAWKVDGFGDFKFGRYKEKDLKALVNSVCGPDRPVSGWSGYTGRSCYEIHGYKTDLKWTVPRGWSPWEYIYVIRVYFPKDQKPDLLKIVNDDLRRKYKHEGYGCPVSSHGHDNFSITCGNVYANGQIFAVEKTHGEPYPKLMYVKYFEPGDGPLSIMEQLERERREQREKEKPLNLKSVDL